MSSNAKPQSTLVTILLIFSCSVIPFLPALKAGFVNWDDTFLITANPAIHGLGWAWIGQWFTSFFVNHYHPLLMLTYAVEHAIAGYEPMLFHGTNLFLHGVNALLVFALLQHFIKDRLALVLAVLFFALHPLRVEPVVWVSARKDLLSTFFIVSSILMFIRYRENKSTSALVITFGLALAASLSKAIAVVIPFLMLAILLTGPKRNAKLPAAVLMPFVALALLTAVIAIFAQYSTGQTSYDPSHSFLRSITLPFWNIVFYAGKSFVPVGLSAIYPFPENGGPEFLQYALLSVVAISVFAITLMIMKPDRPIVLGLAWIFVCLAPILQWIPVGRSFAADRFTYLPAIGLSLIAGILLERAMHLKKGTYRPLVRRAGIVVLAVLGTVSYIRAGVWEKSVTLWMSVLDEYPFYAEGYVYLGSALATEEGNMTLAVGAFSESINLDDRNPDAFSNRALASYRSSSPDSSQIMSDLTSAIALEPGNIEHQVFLAEVYSEYGQTQRSFDACSALLDAYPQLHRARLLRIRSAFQLGYHDIMKEDLSFLRSAGIDVSIEPAGS